MGEDKIDKILHKMQMVCGFLMLFISLVSLVAVFTIDIGYLPSFGLSLLISYAIFDICRKDKYKL